MSKTFIDLFAGIGGFRMGMEQAGHKCVGFCEFDKFAVMSYKMMHTVTEEQRKYILSLEFKERQKEIMKEEYLNGEWYANDIRAVEARSMPKADIWCFGAPCQDFSIAGNRAGLDGDRSSLVREVFRIVAEYKEEDRPEYLIYENVKGMLSSNNGWDFACILVEMESLGYDIEYQLLNSKNFRVPQNRERVFVIGHLRGRGKREVFPIGGADAETSIKQVNDSKNQVYRFYDPSGISPTLNTCQGGGHEPKVMLCGNVNPSGNGMNGNVFSIQGLSPTLTTNKGEGNKIAIPVLTPDRLEKRQNGRRFKEDGEEMFTLTAQDRHGVAIYQRPRGNNKGGLHIDTSPTLTSNSYQENNLLKQGMRIRKLTPRECFRLQGWTDEYFERAASVNSDSQLYKQAGNGVTVTVIKAIAERL